MFKKIKLILLVPALFIPTTTILVGCSCQGEGTPPEEKELEDYVYDRTFSLACSEYNLYDQAWVFGTGWIISDATPTIPTDYCYWIATNWHVTHGFETLSQPINYYFADTSLLNRYSFIDYTSYIKFPNNCFQVETDDHFTYKSSEWDKPTDPSLNFNYFKPGIDLHVCKVMFPANILTPKMKAKLDRVNEYKRLHGYINKFVCGDDTNIINKDKYTAGYPVNMDMAAQGHFGGKWEHHVIPNYHLEIKPRNTQLIPSVYGHEIGSPDHDQYGRIIPPTPEMSVEPFYYYDVSEQYVTKQAYKKSDNWMDGGASGSILITKDFEICGIYWGGITWGQDFLPCFSLFKTENKDFISNYY